MAKPDTAAMKALAINWVLKLGSIGAPLPSGQTLANLMTSRIIHNDIQVLELGAGTGVITRSLLKRGVQEERLILVEIDRIFANHLKLQFPRAHVVQCDVRDLGLKIGNATAWPKAVVSSLPLLCFSLPERMSILKDLFSLIGPAGRLYQFTYGFKFPVSPSALQSLGLSCRYVGTAWSNIPPARVYEVVADTGNS